MKLSRTLALALTLGTLLLAGCGTTKVVTAGPSADTVTVRGNGTALSKPDRATVGLGVEVRESDPRKAMSGVSEASNKLTAALAKAGVAEKDLQTGSVRLEAQYASDDGKAPRLTGYLATVDVSAKTRELAKVGEVIVAGTQAGATRVNGIVFDLDDANPARYEASAEAVKDAKARAQAIAKAAGRTLGQVVSIGRPEPTAPAAYQVHGGYADSYVAAAGAPTPQISPGQLTAGETVEVVFALQ